MSLVHLMKTVLLVAILCALTFLFIFVDLKEMDRKEKTTVIPMHDEFLDEGDYVAVTKPPFPCRVDVEYWRALRRAGVFGRTGHDAGNEP